MRVVSFIPISLLMMCGLQSLAIAEPAHNATAAFNVSPLRLEMTEGREATQMLVRNDSSKTLAIQIRLFRWDQENGDDRYRVSEDFLISPSIVKIESKRTQTLHIIANAAQSVGFQTNYRVVIDQLPQNEEAIAGASQTRLRLTVPLFAGGDQAPLSKIAFVVTNKELIVSNLGGRTAQIGQLAIEQTAKAKILSPQSVPRYIHGGATLRVGLPDGISCDGSELKIMGVIDRMTINAIPTQNCT